MRAKLIRIGNSRGIRLPKVVLEQVGVDDEFEIELKDGVISLTPIASTRDGWEQAFVAMAKQGDDAELLSDHSLSTWEDTEWEW